VQADTIIPGAGNAQAWDRYAAMANNPVKFVDPTGHSSATVMHDSDGDAQCNDPEHCLDASGQLKKPTNSMLEVINEILWESVPSAIGINIGASGQAGAMIEPGIVPGELTALFNWRSGELSVLTSYEAFLYLGTPSVFGGNVYAGWTEVYGASANRFLQGPSVYGGITASADEFAKFGVSAIGGRAVNSGIEMPPQWFIDPKSGHPIEYHQLDITFGGNLGSNGIDAGGFGGGAYTKIRRTYAIPGWPLR
jgi:hypothetical protein